MKACSGTLWVYKILFITEFQQELLETILVIQDILPIYMGLFFPRYFFFFFFNMSMEI